MVHFRVCQNRTRVSCLWLVVRVEKVMTSEQICVNHCARHSNGCNRILCELLIHCVIRQRTRSVSPDFRQGNDLLLFFSNNLMAIHEVRGHAQATCCITSDFMYIIEYLCHCAIILFHDINACRYVYIYLHPLVCIWYFYVFLPFCSFFCLFF